VLLYNFFFVKFKGSFIFLIIIWSSYAKHCKKAVWQIKMVAILGIKKCIFTSSALSFKYNVSSLSRAHTFLEGTIVAGETKDTSST
jgi:hypothetical protein